MFAQITLKLLSSVKSLYISRLEIIYVNLKVNKELADKSSRSDTLNRRRAIYPYAAHSS